MARKYIDVRKHIVHGGLLGCFKRYTLRVTWDRGELPRGVAVFYYDTKEERSERAAYALMQMQRGNTVAFLPTTIAWEPITV